MDNKIEILKIVNTGDENEVKLWDRAEVFIHVFVPIIFYTALNTIIENIFRGKWGEFFPLATYTLLLFGISFFVMKYRKRRNKVFKLTEVEIVEIVKIVLALNGTYFFFAGIRDNGGDAFAMAATNIALYLGFVISLEQLVNVKTWKDIVKCFLNILPKKQFSLPMLIFCFVFGFVGFYLDKLMVCILLSIISVFTVTFVVMFVLCMWRKNAINNMCEKMVHRYNNKKMLILHAGVNQVILRKVIKEITSIREITSLKENKNYYDVVVVLNTFSGRDKKLEIFDRIRIALKTDGIIADPFLCSHKKRSKFCAWFGIPKSLTEFNSIDEYNNLY